MEIEIVERKRKARKPASAYRKKRLKADRDMWASYGLTKPPKPRYVGLQGVLWYLVSQAVRKADYEAYGGFCVDGCGGKVKDWREADCGHFQTASKPATRFYRKNLGLQLKGCNAAQAMGDVSKSTGFAREIDRRYGVGTADEIIVLSLSKVKNMTDDELREKIAHYQSLVDTPLDK